MASDPRLRLLVGTPDSPLAAETLRLLDETRVVIRSGPSLAGGHSVAFAAFLTMVARLLGHVTIETPVHLVPNWWGATDADGLLDRLAAVRPTSTTVPRRDVVVTFGTDAQPGEVNIGGGDWTVRLGTEPQPLDRDATHALGVHAAASLAVSQLLLLALQPVGFPGVRVGAAYVMNLIDYTLTEAPDRARDPKTPWREEVLLAFAGVGSVGSSALSLLASAIAPSLRNPSDVLERPVRIVTVDSDNFDPARNPFRYPALIGGEMDNKATHVASRLADLGLAATAAPISVALWNQMQDQPGFHGLLVSSVDTIPGRQDVADVLARRTLSVGVAGLELHAQREAFADSYACAFCDFVSAEPPLTQAGVYAQLTGLEVTRVLTLLQEGARLGNEDVDRAVGAGKVAADRRDALVGAPLSDLVRQVYAEAELRLPGPQAERGVVAVASPQVSWFAGVLTAAEIVKEIQGLPLLDRRVDVDVSGLPPGLVRRVPADTTGRCVCRSGTRSAWYRTLYSGPAAANP
jgi:hypothetical protein